MTDSFAGATRGVLYPTMASTFKIETLENFCIIVQIHGYSGWLSSLLT